MAHTPLLAESALGDGVHTSARILLMRISPVSVRVCSTPRQSRIRGGLETHRAVLKRASIASNGFDDDLSVGIEPCLVGWSSIDSNGIEMYCCEQPGGEMVCKTTGTRHEECAVVRDANGETKINCSPGLVKGLDIKPNVAQKA
jgi:hypothetical protein